MTAGAPARVELSRASAQLLERLEASGAAPAASCTIEEIRGRLASMRKLAGVAPPLAKVADHTVAGVPARRYEPFQRRDDTVVLFVHGGGWSSGVLEDFDVMCARLADGLARTVISVAYRLAPEAPYPAAVEDCEAALRELTTVGRSVVVVGESAGANLAAVSILKAAEQSRAGSIRLQVLIYPVTDALAALAPASASQGPRLPVDVEEIRMFWDLYAPAGVDRARAEVSPARAAVPTGMPPTQVWLAGHDALRQQGEEFADRLTSAGVTVAVRTWPDEFHGFLTMGTLIPAAGPAWSQVITAIGVELDSDAFLPAAPLR